MKLMKIVSTWLQSSDLAKSKEFMQKLGLEPLITKENVIVYNFPNGGPNLAFYQHPEPFNDGSSLRPGGTFAFEVEDIADSLQYCKQHGLVPEDTQIHTGSSFVSFIIKDHDKNLFEIIQYIE
jgi:hypothetical protein